MGWDCWKQMGCRWKYYQSQLKKSLKNNLNAFEKESLLQDAFAAAEWFDASEALGEVAIDYRVKSEESICSKYERYYPDRPVQKVFNDLLGFRSLCASYEEALALCVPQIKVIDMSHGKAKDDGYRGVHLYYRKDNFHYPIEIQINTFLDRQLNDWLHDYVYKKAHPAEVGEKCGSCTNRGRSQIWKHLRRRLKMCYLIAKNKNGHGCYALKTAHGKALVELKRGLNKEAVPKGVQLVTISRPNAYGEYAPYHL